jgi:hypothetical protein
MSLAPAGLPICQSIPIDYSSAAAPAEIQSASITDKAMETARGYAREMEAGEDKSKGRVLTG